MEKKITNLRRKYEEFLKEKENLKKKQKLRQKKNISSNLTEEKSSSNLTEEKSSSNLTEEKSSSNFIDLTEEKTSIPQLIDLTEEKSDISYKITDISEIISKADKIKESGESKIVYMMPPDPSPNAVYFNVIKESKLRLSSEDKIVPSVSEEMFSFFDLIFEFILTIM